MATCSQCGQYLDQDHRCRGIWRLRAAVIGRVIVGAVIGAVIGAGVIAAVSGMPSLAAIALSAVVGGVITHAFLSGEPRLPTR